MSQDNKPANRARLVFRGVVAIVFVAGLFGSWALNNADVRSTDAKNARLAKEWVETEATVSNIVTVAGGVYGSALSEVQTMHTYATFTFDYKGEETSLVGEINGDDVVVTNGSKLTVFSNGSQIQYDSPIVVLTDFGLALGFILWAVLMGGVFVIGEIIIRDAQDKTPKKRLTRYAY